MPRASAMGSAPAEIIFNPSLKMASARTVAVVVPSPATSLVLLAASLTSFAPMFSYLSFSSTSSATVTPSLVTVGAPQPLSRTALRPRGPSVTFTARASLVTPSRRLLRASTSKANIFAAMPRLLSSPDFESVAVVRGRTGSQSPSGRPPGLNQSGCRGREVRTTRLTAQNYRTSARMADWSARRVAVTLAGRRARVDWRLPLWQGPAGDETVEGRRGSRLRSWGVDQHKVKASC